MNKNIVVLKRHPMNVLLSNKFYVNQFEGWDNMEDYLILDVTSRCRDKSVARDLSPFYIGPCETNDGKKAKIFENFWQFGKVVEGEGIFERKLSVKKGVKEKVVFTDNEGNPTQAWFDIRDFGFNSDIAHRHPFKAKPLYYYYVNEHGVLEKLDYLSSRKKVLMPEYAKLVYKSETFKKLKEYVDSGKKLALLDFDGYNYYNPNAMKRLYGSWIKKNTNSTQTLNDFLNIKSMKDVVNYPHLLAGHAFVLKMMLQGDIEVVDGKIIDKIGVFDIVK